MNAPRAKNLLLRLLPWLALLALLAGLAALRGLSAACTVRYEITNGDFQNYDPVRHLLAGQAPYADFAVYLGAGELYSVAALLALLGNCFANSVLAANALTWFSYELLALAAMAAALGPAHPRAVRAGTLAVSAGSLWAVTHNSAAALWLDYAAQDGNSARMLRAAVLPLAVLAVLAALALWRRWPRRWLHPALLVPFIAGGLVPWSNDTGGAMYIALSLAYGLCLLRRWPRAPLAVLRATLAYIAVSVAGLGCTVLLISHGHPLAWLRQTRGAGAYQAWYYGNDPATRLCYLTDLRPGALFWLLLAAAVLFGVLLLRAPDRTGAVQAGALFTLCLGMALWEVLYAVGSGITAGPEGGAQALLTVLLPALALAALLRARAWPALLHRALPPLCAALAALVLAAGLRGELARRAARAADPALTFVPALGGWLGDQAGRLESELALSGGAPVFSTYASGLEAMTGQLQPTGVDYIIHVLGDGARLRYLQTFQSGYESGLFALACTPSPKVALYERWARNANWWWYRELYRYWQPLANTYNSGGMHLFWQKGGDHSLGQTAQVTVEAAAPGTLTLTVTADDAACCGVADVALRCRLAPPAGFRQRGGLACYLFVDCLTEDALWQAAGREGSADYFLPGRDQETHIPVTVADGVGTVTLTALPAGATLSAEAEVEALYPDWEYFFE